MTQCVRCGAEPITGAGKATRRAGDRLLVGYYCDKEDTKEVTCFELSMWADFPELRMVDA